MLHGGGDCARIIRLSFVDPPILPYSRTPVLPLPVPLPISLRRAQTARLNWCSALRSRSLLRRSSTPTLVRVLCSTPLSKKGRGLSRIQRARFHQIRCLRAESLMLPLHTALLPTRSATPRVTCRVRTSTPLCPWCRMACRRTCPCQLNRFLSFFDPNLHTIIKSSACARLVGVPRNACCECRAL